MRSLAFALLLLTSLLAVPQPAACTWCPTTPCYGPCNVQDCVCLSKPGSTGPGRCFGMQGLTSLKAQGYTEVTD